MNSRAEITSSYPDYYQESLFYIRPDTEYRILKGHSLENGTQKTDEQLREQYLRNTDRLIGIIDGTISDKEPYDVVLYLDKSGRPVAWMVNELWDDLARQAGTSFDDDIVPPRPQTYFLNIDREQWLPTVDPNHTGLYNIDAIPEETIDSLRSIYQLHSGSYETLLSNKRVLVVDEVRATGSTLAVAQQILRRAFPDTLFDTEYWMDPGLYTGKDGVSRNNDVPVWYKANDPTGRAVADRDLLRSKNSRSRVQRLGMWFLSSTFAQVDENSLQLRNEIKQLARDLRHKKVLFTPCPQRGIDDASERICAINGMTIEEFRHRKQS